MNFSDRERRLAVAFGALLVVMAVYFLFLRSDDVIVIPDVPVPTQSASPSPVVVSPTFVVPVGARDPFKP